ncbi:hypothetical protein [Nocardia sp. NPDC057030]|uniref:hypothetical protein n=1 Tax=unclassified Nocardia TaxID=2637762 RepID=UPI003629D7A5
MLAAPEREWHRELHDPNGAATAILDFELPAMSLLTVGKGTGCSSIPMESYRRPEFGTTGDVLACRRRARWAPVPLDPKRFRITRHEQFARGLPAVIACVDPIVLYMSETLT